MESSAENRFAWKATKPGRWERDIDEVEEFYTSLAKAYEGTGRVFFAMTGFISLSVPIQAGSSFQETERRVEEALKNAWIRLRYDHPTIASKVSYDPGRQNYMKVYETFTDTASQWNWADNTFRIVAEGITGLDWCNSDPPVPDLPTLFLIKPPSSDQGNFRADLVLRSHHDIIDGIGTLLLFNNLFTHAAQAYEEAECQLPRFGDEWSNLSPPLRIAANIPATLQPGQKEHMREILEYNASLKKDVEIASPPFQRHNMLPGKHQRVAVTLPIDTTTKLSERCRSLGLSITHAYHAAIALTVGDLQERKEIERTVRYINYCLINERNHCSAPYSTPAHAASAYHSISGRCLAVDLTVPPLTSLDDTATRQSEFLSIAQHIRDYYLKIRDDEEHIKLVPAYWAMSTLPYPESEPPVIPARNETPSVSISSIGVLDKVIRHKYGSFAVDNPWVTGEELGTGLGVFLDTWKRRLTLSAAYNDSWHEKAEVLDVLHRCNDITLKGLGLTSLH